MKRNMIVTRKTIPHPTPTNLSRILSMGILLEYSGNALRSSEVIRRIIAIRANQILRSESVRGMIISITIIYFPRPRKN